MDVGVQCVGVVLVERVTQCGGSEVDRMNTEGEEADKQGVGGDPVNAMDFVYDRFRAQQERAEEEGVTLLRSELLANIDSEVRWAVDMWEQLDVIHWPGAKSKKCRAKGRHRGGR